MKRIKLSEIIEGYVRVISLKDGERERKRKRQILIDLHICKAESLKPFHSSTSQVRTLYPHFLYLLSFIQAIDRNWSEARGSRGRVV